MSSLETGDVLCLPVSIFVEALIEELQPAPSAESYASKLDRLLGALAPVQASLVHQVWQQSCDGAVLSWQQAASVDLQQLQPLSSLARDLIAQVAGVQAFDAATCTQVGVVGTKPRVLLNSQVTAADQAVPHMQALDAFTQLSSKQLAESALLHLAVLVYHEALQAADRLGAAVLGLQSARQVAEALPAAAAACRPLLQRLLGTTAERPGAAQCMLVLAPKGLQAAHAAIADLARWALGLHTEDRIYPSLVGHQDGMAFCRASLSEVHGPARTSSCTVLHCALGSHGALTHVLHGS